MVFKAKPWFREVGCCRFLSVGGTCSLIISRGNELILVCPCICLRSSVLGNADIVLIAPHLPIENFQLGQYPTETMPNLDIVHITTHTHTHAHTHTHTQKIVNLDNVQLGPCPTWTISNWTLSELPPPPLPTENFQLGHFLTGALASAVRPMYAARG